MQKSTPWGIAEHHEHYADGFDFYATPSHGGFHLSEEANSKVPPAFRNTSRWYEEDCEWVGVAFALPDFFTEKEMESARRIAQAWRPEAYAATFPEAA